MMKKDRIIYWITTAMISLIMLFSIYKMFSDEYEHLGFPDYFRIELTILKLIGIAVILVPQIPVRVKDWAYAGFCFVLISASVAHFNSGDSLLVAVDPLFWVIVLGFSNQYLHKLHNI